MQQQICGVILSCYHRYSSSVTRLTPTVLDQVQADSPQEAACLIMEHHGYIYVDRVEVILPDGSMWQRNQMYRDAVEVTRPDGSIWLCDHIPSLAIYKVAIWRTDRESVFPLLGERQTDSPRLAALELMQQNKLTYAARVAVRCPDGSIFRQEHLKITKQESVSEEEEVIL
jgi:hypothetical protein